MPVPTEELKLEIVNAATGEALGSRSAPSADGALVVRRFPAGGPGPEQWRLSPLPAADGAQAYVIRNAAGGKVLDDPAAADRGVRQWTPAARSKAQQWQIVPVDGEAGLFFVEGADGCVLDLAAPGAEDTRVVLRAYDDNAESQRWRFVTAEPERVGGPVLTWAARDHWNGRRSWPLVRSAALRPVPGADPSFSDLLRVLDRYGSDQEAGGWRSEEAALPPGGPANGWAGPGARLFADVTGTGRTDIVALTPAKGLVTSSGRGDGTFEDEERVLHRPVPSPHAADLWTVANLSDDGRPALVVLAADGVRVSSQDEEGAFAPAGGKLVLTAFGHGPGAGAWRADRHPRFLADTTGDGRLDIVGCHDDGVRVSHQNEDGTFAPPADEPVVRAFGHDEKAGAWRADRHPRFLADTTGDGLLDIVGCHDDGVWVSHRNEDGTFTDPWYVLDGFGVDQGWESARAHPRFLVPTAPGGPIDLVGFGPQGVVVARGRGDGTFESPRLVLNDFGAAQGWSGDRHLRLLADVTGDGRVGIVGFGDEGVWVSHAREDGGFEQARLVCRGFGHDDAAGAWRADRHPRFLADVTGDGRLDIVGFGGPGVYVARNLFRRFRTR
ncbi:RICIN domain-containing protein [Streptomyces genisteinicus]|uniref:VCBS repeat-containing protein n=1 Tax=Streptomyces genisteinicus TaxID=2768068 RepID=A0A7H0I0A3_9ACTN|nr:RICIN domain-containing protein [Streptomyces genisteinicus]QNP66219.1 VCBS repeat-containing protein [Streptomyces genisteinicus]